MNQNDLSAIFKAHDLDDYKWIVPQRDIVVAQWVRFRCMYGCSEYGVKGSCPPAVPPVDECRAMLHEYSAAAMFHFPLASPQPEDTRKIWKRMYAAEREVFLAGYYKTFLLHVDSCPLCDPCPAEGTREKCVHRELSRPCLEGLGIDVYQTAKNVGYPIWVVRERDDAINRYALLLVE